MKSIGRFKSGVLEGECRVLSEEGVMYDGFLANGHLSGVGFLYNNHTDTLYQGVFTQN